LPLISVERPQPGQFGRAFQNPCAVFNRPVTIISRCVDRDQKREWPRFAVTQNPRLADYETGWSEAGKSPHKKSRAANVLSAKHFHAWRRLVTSLQHCMAWSVVNRYHNECNTNNKSDN
jgi:hypothetical protein